MIVAVGEQFNKMPRTELSFTAKRSKVYTQAAALNEKSAFS